VAALGFDLGGWWWSWTLGRGEKIIENIDAES